jgi:membrane fusion protein, hemolysin D
MNEADHAGIAANAQTPAPRALIDYDFGTALTAAPRQRLVLWLMAGLIAAAATALAVAKVDIVVSANGRLVTTDSEIVIQPLETSVVRSLAVKMGQKVKAGEVLATLDPTFAGADEAQLEARLRRLKATYDRIAAELAGAVYAPAAANDDEQTQRDVFLKRRDEYAARIAAYAGKSAEAEADLAAHKTEAAGLEQQIRLAEEAEAIYHTLVERDLASRLRLIDTTQHRVEAQSRLATNLGERQKLASAIAAAAAERDAFIGEWQRKLAEEMAQTRSDRDGTAAQLSKARLRRELAVMRAPREGFVLDVAQRPPGSVVREAEPLMRLVPADAPLVAEVEIDTRDVARIHIGDPAALKFEALPWQQYGLSRGVLETLTPDAVEDRNPRDSADATSEPGLKIEMRRSPIHYRAQIALTQTRFRDPPQGFALRPGMRLVAEIQIGRRSILQYVLNPLTHVVGESLHEP